MKKALKPCTAGTRHKWQFVRNRIIQSGGPTSIHISKRGVYQCACGETKIGEPAHD